MCLPFFNICVKECYSNYYIVMHLNDQPIGLDATLVSYCCSRDVTLQPEANDLEPLRQRRRNLFCNRDEKLLPNFNKHSFSIVNQENIARGKKYHNPLEPPLTKHIQMNPRYEGQ